MDQTDFESTDFNNPLSGESLSDVRGIHIAADRDQLLLTGKILGHAQIDEVASVEYPFHIFKMEFDPPLKLGMRFPQMTI